MRLLVLVPLLVVIGTNSKRDYDGGASAATALLFLVFSGILTHTLAWADAVAESKAVHPSLALGICRTTWRPLASSTTARSRRRSVGAGPILGVRPASWGRRGTRFVGWAFARPQALGQA
jgi:hypothetical protein